MQLFDTHAHLDDDSFVDNLDEVLARAHDAGVVEVLAIGTTADSSRTIIDIAARYSSVHAAVGIQPNYCAETGLKDWDHVVELADHVQVVALGETGLDRFWNHAPFDLQQDYFERHLNLSQDRELPCIIHMRDCEQDILEMLRKSRQRGPLSGVMHSFTGSQQTAEECLELGLWISFAGMVTYKKSESLRGIAATIPEDRLLVETDAPYLSPHPVRGRRPNEPALVLHTARCLAEVRGVQLDNLAAKMTVNARRLFRTNNHIQTA